MASFDVIDAAGKGYALAWQERKYLLRLAAGPLLIKLTCYTTVVALGWELDFLRQALVMLPSYFADGWMLAHLVRLVFLNQRWPFRPSGDRDNDIAQLQDRAQGIMAGMVSFVLIKFLLAGFTHLAYRASVFDPASGGAAPEPSLFMALAGIVAIFALLWAFRLIWLYIPAAVGYPLRRFLKEISGYMTSIYMAGVWFICFVPAAVLFTLLVSVFLAPLGVGGGDSTVMPAGIEFVLAALRVALDTAVAILATASLCHGIRAMIAASAGRVA